MKIQTYFFPMTLLLLLCLLGACLSIRGDHFKWYNADKIAIGMDREEVMKIMDAEPLGVYRSEDQGKEIITWAYIVRECGTYGNRKFKVTIDLSTKKVTEYEAVFF